MSFPTTIIALKSLCKVVAFVRIISRGSTTISHTVVVWSVLILNTSELRLSRLRNTWKKSRLIEPEWTWCHENDQVWAGLLEVDSRLTSSISRALFTISASALSSSSRSFFFIWLDLRPTTKWYLSWLSS